MRVTRFPISASVHLLRPAVACGLYALALLLLMACQGGEPAPSTPTGSAPPPWPTAVFPDGTVVKLDLALTPEEQERGLMFVEELPADRGMLFIYGTDDVRPFWMKNCKISLDFIWLAADGRVVDITREAPPCPGDPCPTFQASAPSRFNLEVRGGVAAAHGLKPGDRVQLKDIPGRGD